MDGFLQALKVQRWDDHRYYHHSRINQALHLVSASSFVCCAGGCADLSQDPVNCGTCTFACGPSQHCVGGQCL